MSDGFVKLTGLTSYRVRVVGGQVRIDDVPNPPAPPYRVHRDGKRARIEYYPDPNKKPTVKVKKDGPCEGCGRRCQRSKHHVKPKALGGQKTIRICSFCHTFLHEHFSHSQLAAMPAEDQRAVLRLNAKRIPPPKLNQYGCP